MHHGPMAPLDELPLTTVNHSLVVLVLQYFFSSMADSTVNYYVGQK
jgi:hypothetical protein